MKAKIITIFTMIMVMLAACAPPQINPSQPQATSDPLLAPAAAEQATADKTGPQAGYVYSQWLLV